jgi:putative SOS response-associated peptidase YedK
VRRQRWPIAASGFWEAEQPARARHTSSWSSYGLTDRRPSFMAGLWSQVQAPETGEVGVTYTLLITDANTVLRVHGRLSPILGTRATPGRARPTAHRAAGAVPG